MAEIVQAEGWARFRELETLSLKAVTLPNTVIATGGGIVLAKVTVSLCGRMAW
ncbi:Shikimate kinase III [Klebsiella pneumoniae]|nr:Shikimate kinase III [Klebsiella pneumoniae]